VAITNHETNAMMTAAIVLNMIVSFCECSSTVHKWICGNSKFINFETSSKLRTLPKKFQAGA